MSHQFGLLDRVSAFVVVLDSAGHIVWCNLAAERGFGYALGDIRGRRLQVLLSAPEQADEVERALRFARTNPDPVSLELACFTRGGERRWLTWTLSRLGEGSEEILGSGVDITRRKQAEEMARFLVDAGSVLASSLDYQQTLRSIAQLAVHAYADLCIIDLVDEAGEVRRIHVSARDTSIDHLARGLMKYPSQSQRPYLGAHAIRTGQSLVVPRVEQALLEKLAQDENHLKLLREVGPRSFMAVPLMVRDKVIGSLIFISTRAGRSYGDEDVRSAEQLGGRAALAIDNARLYLEAQRASQARDEVLGVVAHDLRSPLNGIALTAAVLQRRAERQGDPQLRELGDGVAQAVSQMNRLVQDLLDKTRIDAGRLSVDARPTPAGDLLARAAESLRQLAPQVGLEVVVAPDLPPVLADPLRIRQVFANLLSNALKFTPQGGRIELGAQRAGEEVEFWVRDEGPGIPPEQLPFVFERFWQGKKADTRGVGLGLAIVKGIVESHGGEVRVESAPGQGATLWFTLPSVEAARP